MKIEGKLVKSKFRIRGIKEYLKFHTDLFYQRSRSRFVRPSRENLPLCFIAGCGRSGTTFLGRIISKHPDVAYLNEPRTMWITISPLTDIWGYSGANKKLKSLIMKEPKRHEVKAFKSLFGSAGRNRNIIVEKTPENAFRIPWLKGLSPHSKMIHLKRNGRNVINSIVSGASFDIPFGTMDMNNWYGADCLKKRLLSNTALQLGINFSVIESCACKADWAALEWICTMRSIFLNRGMFSRDSFMEVRYEDLVEKPWETYKALLIFLGSTPNLELKTIIENSVRSSKKASKTPILSPGIREEFEKEQFRQGYTE